MFSWKLKLVIALGVLLSVGLLVAAAYVYGLSKEPAVQVDDANAPVAQSDGRATSMDMRDAKSKARTAERLASRAGVNLPRVPGAGSVPSTRTVASVARKIRNAVPGSKGKIGGAAPAEAATGEASPAEATAAEAGDGPAASAPAEAAPAQGPAGEAAPADAPPAPKYATIKPMALVPLSVLSQGRVAVPPPDMPLHAPTAEELAAPPALEAPVAPALIQDQVMFSLQSGIFASIESASHQRDRIVAKGGQAEIYTFTDDGGKIWYSIGVGNYRSFSLADLAARRFRQDMDRQVRVMVLRASELADKQLSP